MANDQNPAPKVFISHGSEDKERFVEAFAQELRANGIEAWYDRWEIGPGDSMVQRIFDEGIGQAQAVIIVLSHTSVVKPWVRAELETAVVQRITKAGIQLIPVVIDQDTDVPVALRSLRWISAEALDVPKAAAEVVDHLFNVTRKPLLGKPPAYLTTKLNLLDNAVDDTVLNIILETFAELGPRVVIRSILIEEKASRLGISAEAVRDSIYVLHRSGKVKGNLFAGGTWMLNGVSLWVWLQYATTRGLDLDAFRASILADVVNTGTREIDPERFEAPAQVISALLDEFQGRGLLKFSQVASGRIIITQVSPLAKRALAQLTS
ncbi:toll/interleukin-1 receptor domain-containing protein [uncultured Citricoccus sp.]|uniref:toll/interleukin-1 receptor domain-containing protein n=1 Tax=uncultured Citricoccus sp. TaxID=614031 RepID=UPI00261712E3|nr:toll/interleukin-1 receptor domain-containing protein [uncultured Citricoccus sp.]